MAQYKRCGRSNCRCAGAYRHGPFFYHVVYICGKRVKRYVKQAKLGQYQAGILAFQTQKAEARAVRDHSRELIRSIRENSRELELVLKLIRQGAIKL